MARLQTTRDQLLAQEAETEKTSEQHAAEAEAAQRQLAAVRAEVANEVAAKDRLSAAHEEELEAKAAETLALRHEAEALRLAVAEKESMLAEETKTKLDLAAAKEAEV